MDIVDELMSLASSESLKSEDRKTFAEASRLIELTRLNKAKEIAEKELNNLSSIDGGIDEMFKNFSKGLEESTTKKNNAQDCIHTIVFSSDNFEFSKIVIEVIEANGLELLVNRTLIRE